MDAISIIVIITALLNLSLGYFIFTRGAKNWATYSLALFAFVAGIWGISFYFYAHPVLFSSLIWMKIILVEVFLMISSFFYFSFIFPTKLKFSLLFLVFYWVIAIPLILQIFFTDLWIKDIILKEGRYFSVLGSSYKYFGIFIWFFALWATFNLISQYRKTKGILKTQVMYVLLGGFLYGISVSIPDVIIPLVTGSSEYFAFSPISALFLAGFTAYAITRYRLMDIRLVIGRGAVYLFSLITVISLGFLILFLNNKLATPISINIIGPLILTIGILIFQPVFRFFEKFASKYFYYTFYSYQTVLTDLGRKLTQFLELNKLSSLIVSTLMETMKLDRTVVLLREPGNGDYQIQKNIGFREENGISLVKDNFLTIWLERTQKPLVREELSLIIRDVPQGKEREKLENLQSNMKRIEAALCLPLLIERKIVGMIVLGNKISGDPYSEQDINLLTNLSNQASTAIQNAKLYSEVRGFSVKLEREVEKRTKELKEAYEELKKLDKAKSEFISIASHQLRTPLAAIKGYISMMLEKVYGKPPDKMEKPLENIYTSNERLIKLVNDLLNISRIEAGRMELKLEKASVEEIISSVIMELENEAKIKEIYLKFEKPEKPLPKILIDKDKIRQVILNVIDNAIRYTGEGGVTIKLKIENLKFKIIVSDTGTGLTKNELSKMFESFSRGVAGTQLYTEGVGLGLYVAKRFVEMHKGKIWAESKEKGNGSTFYIELPIK